MPITSDQCRAARSLLSWNQADLAENALISRATVADFELNARQPIRNNLQSIEDCLFAAGVEFLGEHDDKGVGVRFRKKKLGYMKNVKVDRFNRRAIINMCYGGENFDCVVDLHAIDDFNRTNFSTDNEYSSAIGEIFHTIISAVEKQAALGIEDGRIIVTYEMLRPTDYT